MEEISTLERDLALKLVEREGWRKYVLSRRSGVEFDISIVGEFSPGPGRPPVSFRAWLPLAVISSANWTLPAIWDLTDAYGEAGLIPPQDYDWSGVRDSSKEAIWAMFKIAQTMLD